MSQTKAQLVGGVGFSTADSLTVHNGLAVTGVVTATSFVGSGANLTGLANTDFINAEQITVVGLVTATTFDGNLTGNVTGNVTGTANLASGITGVPGIAVGIITATSAALTDNISAASGTFTGNVTVGGTLTYDDVTNVDSIGVVTARTGVQFGLAGVGGSVSGTGNANFAGIVTATSLDASIAFWTLGASGSNHYTFTGPGDLSDDTDPDLQLIRGQKYIFKNRSGGHPFRIQSTPNGSAGTAYNDGVTNNDAGNGTDLIFDVPFDAPSILYYQCTSHGSMGGRIYIGSSSGDDVNVGLAITMYASSGIVSATSFYGDGSTLSGIDASPSIAATASGALTNGATVIVNTDGSVSAVLQEAASKNVGSTTNASTGDCPEIDAVFDPTNNKVIVFYQDQGSSGLYVSTGTVSGTSITFGTQQTVASSGAEEPSIDIVGTGGKVVMAYRFGTSGLRAKIATVSDSSNSVVQGSETLITNYESRKVSVSRSNTSNGFLIAFKKQVTEDNKGQCVACTFSGTTITVGTPVQIEAHSIDMVDTVFDPDNTKVVVVYKNNGSDDDGKFAVCTTSGTTATVNTTGYFKQSDTIQKFIKISYDTLNNRHLIVFTSGANNSEGMYIVGTLSGTTMTFGSPAFFANSSDRPEAGAIAFDTNARKWIIQYQETSASNKPRFRIGTYSSSTAISWADETDISTGVCNANSVVFDSNANKCVALHNDNSNTQLEANVVTVPYSRTNLTTENYIGIADAAYSDGATATIQTVGAVDDAQSGLTAGQKYFVQEDGTLGLTESAGTGTLAGKALSATKLLILTN